MAVPAGTASTVAGLPAHMTTPAIDDARAVDPLERLLEDSWDERARRMSRRELLSESLATALFLLCSVPLAASALGSHVDLLAVVVLVPLYAVLSRLVKFPIGAGYVVPSYVALVPMLLLLPPGLVPLLTAAALATGAAVRWALRRTEAARIVFSIPDAWHAVGPAVVLMVAGTGASGWTLAAVYLAAFAAGGVADLVSATLREAGGLGIAPQLQLRVVAVVLLPAACLAPLGLLVAHAARHQPAEALLVLPVTLLLFLLVRDRNDRIESAQRRLELVAHERTRLQSAVGRLGDAFAAKLDLDALLEILLRSSVEAVDADGGRLTLAGAGEPRTFEIAGGTELLGALAAAAGAAEAAGRSEQAERAGAWALALPFSFAVQDGRAEGVLAVTRRDRGFREDEQALIAGLGERAGKAAEEIVANQALRDQAVTDALTGLGNRRRLAGDLATLLARPSVGDPVVLMLFDLDGFKSYNDTFGHPAGDALLARLGSKLAASVAPHGSAYRLGGDEFCALLEVRSDELHAVIGAAAAGLEERGERFAIGASYGAVLLPPEATTAEYAIQLADERMYARKQARGPRAADPARDVLLRIMQARGAELHDHAGEVAQLALRVGRRLQMTAEELDELARGAELHDIGKVAIPDAILEKPAPLNPEEWEFMRQHTLLGERILSAAAALRPVAAIVRATHERWDGRGYPDGVTGAAIPLGARIIAVCDAFDAMTTARCYRESIGREAACDELRREAGRQFDPAVVEAFLAELDERRATPRPTRVLERGARSTGVD